MVMLALQVAVSVLLFAGVAMAVYGVFAQPVASEPPIHRRFAAAMGYDRGTVFEHPVLAPVLTLALGVARRAGVPGIRARVRQDLDASGNPSGYSVDEYLAICLLSGAGLGLAALLLDLLMGGRATLFVVPLLSAAGFAAPLWALRSAAQKRVQKISLQLPYTLDLIALVMAAGSGFTEAVETLIRDQPEDELNQELKVALSEIEFGVPRARALANLADRVPHESLRSIIGAVNQAESLGTPLASILKLQAKMLRMQRSVRAEKLSASASLRILVPSMVILIAVVGIVFAPLIIRFLRGELM
jgi:tight adherence protein C